MNVCCGCTFPSFHPKRMGGTAETKGEEVVCMNQHVFRMDVRNWDNGGITNVPGLSVLQTHDIYTHKHKQTYIY